MSEEEIVKYVVVTNDKVIIDRNFYNKVLLPCMDKGVNFKNILTEFEKWLEEKLKEKTYNTFPTFDLEKHDFVNNKMYFSRVDKIYKEVLDKLKELKEGKK